MITSEYVSTVLREAAAKALDEGLDMDARTLLDLLITSRNGHVDHNNNGTVRTPTKGVQRRRRSSRRSRIQPVIQAPSGEPRTRWQDYYPEILVILQPGVAMYRKDIIGCVKQRFADRFTKHDKTQTPRNRDGQRWTMVVNASLEHLVTDGLVMKPKYGMYMLTALGETLRGKTQCDQR